MAESNRNDEPRVLTESFIKKIDELTKSPSQRAGVVWVRLNESQGSKLSNWDLICFCAETLGLMSSEFPWLKEAAMSVSNIIFKAHYINHDRIIASEHEIALDDSDGEMKIPRMTRR